MNFFLVFFIFTKQQSVIKTEQKYHWKVLSSKLDSFENLFLFHNDTIYSETSE